VEWWIFPAMAGAFSAALMARWFFQSPMADAMAERVRQQARRRRHWKGFGGEWVDAPPDEAGTDERTRAVEERLSQVEGQLAEMAERLDFAERLLAERRREQLGAGH
jgi:hypothetical protein